MKTIKLNDSCIVVSDGENIAAMGFQADSENPVLNILSIVGRCSDNMIVLAEMHFLNKMQGGERPMTLTTIESDINDSDAGGDDGGDDGKS